MLQCTSLKKKNHCFYHSSLLNVRIWQLIICNLTPMTIGRPKWILVTGGAFGNFQVEFTWHLLTHSQNIAANLSFPFHSLISPGYIALCVLLIQTKARKPPLHQSQWRCNCTFVTFFVQWWNSGKEVLKKKGGGGGEENHVKFMFKIISTM